EEERIQHSESISMFSSGQQQAYSTIINTVDTNIRPNTFFLQGPAGGIVLCVASSGIASLLLLGGSSAHSLFRIPIECTDSSRCHISRQTKLARLLTVTKLIIWDEVTMQNKHNFNALDKTLRDLMNSDELFGGIPIVLGGDFAQILPVVKRGQRQDIMNAYLPDWIQTTDDRQFFKQFIYPGHIIQFPNAFFFLKRAILTSRNDAVDVFNRGIADLTNSESHDYFSLDIAQNDRSVESTDYTSEFLQAISGKGIPLGKLSLRVGMPIMLLPKIMSQDPRYNGREHIISRITLSTSEDLPFTLTRKQLPIRPCYAMTINKSQGQTLQSVGIDLTTPVFSHGQLYVAFSRVTDVNNLIVLLPSSARKTTNVVYPEVLLQPPIPT
ncbi:hypothetical protein EPUL_005415, partial [Erysiphe pulchra]